MDRDAAARSVDVIKEEFLEGQSIARQGDPIGPEVLEHLRAHESERRNRGLVQGADYCCDDWQSASFCFLRNISSHRIWWLSSSLECEGSTKTLRLVGLNCHDRLCEWVNATQSWIGNVSSYA